MKHKVDKIKQLIGKPQEGADYYYDELKNFIVTIETNVTSYRENISDEKICRQAIEAIRNKKGDCSSEIVFSEKIKKVTRDGITNLLFDENVWQSKKLAELGLNENGDKLRPWEKDMPESQKRLVIA